MQRSEIEAELLAAPGQIATAERESLRIKGEIKKLQKRTAERETEIMSKRSAKEWGSNDVERKTNRDLAFGQDRDLRSLFISCFQLEEELATNETEVARLKNWMNVLRTLLETKAAFALAARSPLANSLFADDLQDLGV